MKTHRRILVVAALAATALTMSACSATATGGGPKTDTPAKAGGLIAIITPAPSNVFFKAEADAAAAEAKKLGYTTSVASHDDDPNKQSNLIDTAITRHAKAIILDNAGADASIGPVEKATKAGIPVFLIDREINKAGVAKAQIVANNAQGAAEIAGVFAKSLNGKGNYFELTGLASDTNAAVREQGVAGILSQYPDLKMVGSQAADWDQTKAFNITETLLQRTKDVQGIIADNDTMAMGVIAALKAAGLAGKVKVVGFDGSPDAVAAIKAGTMVADEMQPATLIAQTAVQQADKFLKTGKTGQAEKQSIDCTTLDSSNIAKYTLFGLSS
jgi:erythritol transport system substrate-binding protein